ncbi:MAG: DUF1648 domain-containing protein [Dehalococcoidales bacterium]|nr:DUF1648 domain-containing protein [Dehalococcoidales bacterium]
MWQKLSKCYPIRLELIPLFMLAFTLYIALSNYTTLPEIIPTHFNGQGTPDDWGSKNTIFLLLGLNIFIYLLFTVLNIAFAVIKDPRSLINMPDKWKAALSSTQIERLRVIMNRYLFALKITIQGLTGYIIYITIEIAWERTTDLGALFYVFILAIFATIGLMLWQILRISKTHSIA